MEVLKVEKTDSGTYEISIAKDSEMYKEIIECVRDKLSLMGIHLPNNDVFI